MSVRMRTAMRFGLLIILTITSLSMGQIHRAKPDKTKGPSASGGAMPRFPPGAFSDFDNEATVLHSDLKENDNNMEFAGHSWETWIYSLVSASLVGLSGIFPLLVIPLEAGKALRKGAPAARLKLFLSFAVGGLLGDVFLHLLPEAWAHLNKHGHGHQGHLEIGLWVLTGIFSFLIVEKIFPSESDEEDDDDESESEQKPWSTDHNLSPVQTSTQTHHEKNTTRNRKGKKGKDSPDVSTANGHAKGKKTKDSPGGSTANGHTNRKTENGSLQPNGINGHVVSNGNHHHSNKAKKAEATAQESHIKTSGWLNLVANVIDNFTHGLAVAGSYCISTKTGLITTAAVLLHEVPHEVGDFAILLRSGFDRWKAAKAQVLTASGGLLGALVALSAESAQAAGDRTAWILPFTSGGFIYIALVTVVPELLTEKNIGQSALQVFFIILGILLVSGVTLLCE